MSITLKAARVNAGLRQLEVASELDIDISTLIRWEKYGSYPPVDKFKKMCGMYKVKMEDIFLPDTLT